MDIASMELDLELEAALAEPLEFTSSLNTEEESQITNEEMEREDIKLVGDETVDRFEALPRPTAIFLHGVDDMSTIDITTYCNDAKMTKVEWINDSSCNLVFNTEEQAKEALSNIVANKEAVLNHKELVIANPFIDAEGRSHNLFVRISTDEDVKERGARQRSRYYMIHGTESENISKERQEARKEHYARQTKSGGDGRSVFSRLGNKTENNRRRGRSVSPSRKEERSTKRERSVEREIPSHLKSRLGPLKADKEQESIKQETMMESNATDDTFTESIKTKIKQE